MIFGISTKFQIISNDQNTKKIKVSFGRSNPAAKEEQILGEFGSLSFGFWKLFAIWVLEFET